jgi:D-glycero-D-manno-heptose 1,7-bisphosphate phosphatase
VIHHLLRLFNHRQRLLRACTKNLPRLKSLLPEIEALYHAYVKNMRQSFSLKDLETIFLDRDGVLNRKMPEGEYVRSLADFHVLAGVPEAIAQLNQQKKRVLVASNQRGVALGLYTLGTLHAIHEEFQQQLARADAHIDGFFVCPHDKNSCECRKPRPGLFLQAQKRFPALTAARSLMIGDSLSDIEFAKNLGMKAIFIEGDPTHRKPGAEKAVALADACCTSLAEAVALLLD